jgi:hypothetical protein
MVFIEKTQTPPASLAIEKKKKNGSCNKKDVLALLQKDFYGKCYICEQSDLTSINVEHFLPHHQGKDINRKFDWFNLFWACSHCNVIKGQKEEFLNCTDPNHHIEDWIFHFLKPVPKEKPRILIASNAQIPEELQSKVQNTITLLNDVYNGTTDQNKIQANAICNKLSNEILDFVNDIWKYDRSHDEKLKKKKKRKIKNSLQRSSPFAAFKRRIIRDSEIWMKEFGKFLN